MDKASAPGARDSRFESWAGHSNVHVATSSFEQRWEYILKRMEASGGIHTLAEWSKAVDSGSTIFGCVAQSMGCSFRPCPKPRVRPAVLHALIARARS